MKADTLKELLEWTPPHQDYIIDRGILAPQTKLIIFGRFQTWKSMIAMHTGFCLATGRPWFGFKTKQSAVYSLQTEIPKPEFQKRIHKYCLGNQTYPDNIYLRTEHYIKLDEAYGNDDISKELEESLPQVLIIDPLYKVMRGRLTDDYDARRLIDRLDLLIAKYKVAIILVHHDRKPIVVDGAIQQSAMDMFGSSIFIDWCDSSIRVNPLKADGEVVLTFEKARNAEEELKPLQIKVNRNDLTFRY